MYVYIYIYVYIYDICTMTKRQTMSLIGYYQPPKAQW